jgi:hypothetical protein
MEHLSLHSVGTSHKKFGWEKKKTKIYFAECCVGLATLGKETTLPSAKAWRSTKVMVVSYRQLLTALCRVFRFAESLALGKTFFAKCFPVPSVLLLINVCWAPNRPCRRSAVRTVRIVGRTVRARAESVRVSSSC